MGNSITSTNVFLSVNNQSMTCIKAGSTISGELRCPDYLISNDIFSLTTLYFIGKEDVEVAYTESSHGTRPHRKGAKRDIIRTIIPLDTSSRNESGSYPFSFHIPDQLPSSMYYKDGNGGFCSIRYKVKLHQMRARDQEIPIEIMAKPPSHPKPSVLEPTVARIQLLYCIPRGNMTWAVGINDTRVGKGESLTINLGIKNDSRANLERVTCKLKQNVEWHTARHSSTNKSIIRSSSFSKSDSMNATSKKTNLRPTPQRQSKSLAAYEEILCSNKMSFPIPDYVCQSYTGRLIQIRHYISIKAKTPSCYTDPKIHIPIEIVSPRDTPVVMAHAIPFPSAPPFLSSESESYLYASPGGSAASPYFATTFVVSGDTAGNDKEDEEEEEIVLDAFAMDNSKQTSMTGADEQHSVNYEDVAPFDSTSIEPFIARDDSGGS